MTLGNWNGSVYDKTGGTLIIEDDSVPGPIVHADLDGTVTTPVQNSITTMTGLTAVGTTAIDTTFSGTIIANEGIKTISTLDVSGVTNFETDVTFNGGLIDFSSAMTLGNWNGPVYDRTGATLIIEDDSAPAPIVHADLDGTVTTTAQNSIATMTGLTAVGTTAIDTTFSGPIVANEGITSTGNITMTSKFIKQF